MVAAAWWPIGSYWQSDDFIAVHHTQSLDRAVADWFGPQYGMPALVLFYRPLITWSFVFDGWFGDAAPFVAHLSNAIAHGLSAALLAAIVLRFSSRQHAFAAGLVWGSAPSHASSVFWSVGRVDSHTTVWIMLATLLLVQWCRGERATRRASVACFVLALASKELALVVPGIAAVVCFACSPSGQRLRACLRGSWPYFVVLAVYAAARWARFGEIGGYEGTVDWTAAARGLGWRVAQLINPLLYAGRGFAAERGIEVPQILVYAGFLPAAAALAVCILRRRFALLAVLAVLFLGCCVPIAQLLAEQDNPKNLRNFYLAMAPLAVASTVWGWRTGVPILALAVLPFLELRADYMASWRRCARWHEQIRSRVPPAKLALNFISGLPRENVQATALEFDQGVDRLLAAPWGEGHRVFALRPLLQSTRVNTLPYGSGDALPFGGTFVRGPEDLGRVIARRPLAPLEWRWEGPTALTRDVLDQMVKNHLDPARRQRNDPEIVLPQVRSRVFRVTVFGAGGYVTTYVRDSAAGGATDGRIAIGQILVAPADAGGTPAAYPLRVCTALDLTNRFPVLIEADTRPDFDGRPVNFRPTHANIIPAWLHLDRQFAAWWRL